MQEYFFLMLLFKFEFLVVKPKEIQVLKKCSAAIFQ